MCLWAIYKFPGSVHIFSCSRIGRLIVGIYKCSQTHECVNWDWYRAISFLGIFVSNFRYCVFAECSLRGHILFQICSRTIVHRTCCLLTLTCTQECTVLHSAFLQMSSYFLGVCSYSLDACSSTWTYSQCGGTCLNLFFAWAQDPLWNAT